LRSRTTSSLIDRAPDTVRRPPSTSARGEKNNVVRARNSILLLTARTASLPLCGHLSQRQRGIASPRRVGRTRRPARLSLRDDAGCPASHGRAVTGCATSSRSCHDAPRRRCRSEPGGIAAQDRAGAWPREVPQAAATEQQSGRAGYRYATMTVVGCGMADGSCASRVAPGREPTDVFPHREAQSRATPPSAPRPSDE
jgi:hypothetical protein